MSGKTLLQFGFLLTSREQGATVSNHQYLSEVSYNTIQLSQAVALNVPKLNQEQKKAYNEIMHSIASDSGQLFFLDAPDCTGKTFLVNLLLAKIRSRRNIALAVVSSGIAATLIDGGKTAHFAFKLPLNLNHSESSLCNISKQSDMAQALREAKLIAWDEKSLQKKR